MIVTLRNWSFNGKIFIDRGEPQKEFEAHEARITNLSDKRVKEVIFQDHGQEVFRMLQSDGWILALRQDPAASRLYFSVRFKTERNMEVQKEFFSTDLKWVPEPAAGWIPENTLRIPLFEQKK